MSSCYFSSDAARDLQGIYDSIASENHRAALEVIDKIDRACEMLAEFPLAGRNRFELALRLRCFPSEAYLIFYRPRNDGVEVIRVLHGARDYEKLLRS